MNYIDETLTFIESDEMREYLRSYLLSNSDKHWIRSECAEIVANARASLERKIPALDLIAEQTDPNTEHNFHDPVYLAKFARSALGEEQKGPPGTVFQLSSYIYHELGFYDDYRLYYEFKAAMRCIKRFATEYEGIDHDVREKVHFLIEKYIPGDDGEMDCKFYWITDSYGEIWYFGADILGKVDDFFDYIGDVNLPVPFKSGDIVTADCRPFAKERRVLIVDIGDNKDCCAVQCMYLTPDNKLDTCAFKHHRFLSYPESTMVSALYRAARYHGELDKSEHPLGVVSAAIKANPKLGEELMKYIRERPSQNKRVRDAEGNLEHRGIRWDELRNEFGF